MKREMSSLNWKRLATQEVQVLVLSKEVDVLLRWLKPLSAHDEVTGKVVALEQKQYGSISNSK